MTSTPTALTQSSTTPPKAASISFAGIRKAFNYEAQIAKLEEEIERYQKLKLRLYEDLSDGIIDKSEYFEFRNSYTKIIEEKQEALLRVKKEMKQTLPTAMWSIPWAVMSPTMPFSSFPCIAPIKERTTIPKSA